jgi:hypothetical protein
MRRFALIAACLLATSATRKLQRHRSWSMGK